MSEKEIPASKRKKIQRQKSRVRKAVAEENERRQPRRNKKKRDQNRQESQQNKPKRRRISDAAVHEAIMEHVAEAGPGGSVRPEDIARALWPEAWQTLLKRIRLMIVQLARVGKVEILRKGEVADPDDFRGVYKVRVVKGEGK